MSSLQLIPFDDTHLAAAAVLLAARHQRDRVHEPALPSRFEASEAAQAAAASALREADASGVAALRDGQLVGFLIGAPEIAEIWGRSVWVRYGGHALASAEDAGLYRDLYAAAAPHWLARGCFAHYVESPADDRAGLDAWVSLSFGLQQAYGLCPLPADDLSSTPLDPAITIRRAGPDDLDTLVELQGILFTHLGRSPVYSVRLPEESRRWPAAWAERLADPQVALWLAEREGVALGVVEVTPLTLGNDQLDVPESCCYLHFAATREAARGRGVSTALTAHALAEAHAAGYVACLTDWRTTNLQAARLWPHLGFRPFQYRLHRLIDERIAWAPTFPQ
jgi:ribosomal protein S18 acetylase RimI-like enzyme